MKIIFNSLLILSLLIASSAHAGNSSQVLYEILAKHGLENWRDDGGGAIVLHSFACNYTFLKDVNVKSHQCWLKTIANACTGGDTTSITDETEAVQLFDALKQTGLPIITNSDSGEDWSQITADSLNCDLTIDRTYSPPKKIYSCNAVQRLKN